MKKLAVVYGTRPEIIKLVPLILKKAEFKKAGIELLTVFTGQHRQMVDMIHERFNIKPDFDLNLMKDGQTLNSIVINCLTKLDEVCLNSEKFDGIIVQGDTTTCMAAGLYGFYNKIPVFHVEAGLRSHDIHSPYPEEFNRRVVGLLADLHFAPSEVSEKNLLAEGIAKEKILITGNTSIDTLLMASAESYHVKSDLKANVQDFINDDKTKLILVTAHRRENFGDPIREVFTAIKDCLKKRSDVRFLFFAHLNPMVQSAIKEVFTEPNPRLLIEPPQEYFGFIKCLKASHLVLSDSGGLQEEAPALGKPVLVTRDNTERPEALLAGSSLLVGTKKSKILGEIDRLLDNREWYFKMSQARNPFGNGTASQSIMNAIINFYSALRQ
jgi:UDP-N-acetylglucosamine 2-epimerase (non-hydrolysing)